MRVSEIFATGGGPGYGDGSAYGGPRFEGRFTYVYYSKGFDYYKPGELDGSGFNGGLRNESFSRGRGLLGVRG